MYKTLILYLDSAPQQWLKYWLSLLALVTIVLLPVTSLSQTADSSDVITLLKSEKSYLSKSLQTLDARIATLQQIETPNSSQKTELNWLTQTHDFLHKGLAAIERAQDYYQAYQGIPLRLRSIEKELSSPLPSESKIDQAEPLSSLENKLEIARADLNTARYVRNEIETEATQRSERLQKISIETSNVRKRQEELSQLLAAPTSGDDTEIAAKQSAAQAELSYLRALLIELEQEQRSYDTRRELLRARRQQAERQLLIVEQRFNVLEQRVNQLRTTAAAQAMQAAENVLLSVTSAHPLVRNIVDQNQQLATELTLLSTQNTVLSDDKKKLSEQLSFLQRRHDAIKEKIAQIGLTDAIGLKLRSDRNQLPEIGSYIKSIKKRRPEINRVQLRRIEIEDRLLELVDIKREVQYLINTSAGEITELEQQALQNALTFALTDQRDTYLNELVKAYDIHFEKYLLPMMETEQALVNLINQYREFIDTRILWVQSSPRLQLVDVMHLSTATMWLLNPASITQTVNSLSRDFINHPITIGSVVIFVILLVSFYNRLRNKLTELGRYVTKLSKAKFSDTFKAALITSLMVLPWPMLIYLIAWRTEMIGIEESYALALSSGLYIVAYLLFLGLLLRRICRPNGLGESHFRWKTDSMNLIRRHLTWFLPTSLPLAFIVASTLDQPIQSHHDSLGRFAFIALMVASSVFVFKLFRPYSGILKNHIAKCPGGWLDRLSGIWFPLLVMAPMALAITSILGYFYTSIQLCLYLVSTAGLILIAKLAREFFIRWLNITQRKLALEQWRKKLEAKTETSPEKSDTNEPAPNEEPELDVGQISTQTMRLINSAYWFAIIVGTILIWSDVLPALKLLNDIVLWTSETTAADNSTIFTPTTLANLLLAVTILLVTLFISRNIPGLLEIAVLQHLPFTPSGRYAITTITRYFLVIIGLAMTFNAIGIGWSKVQWLAAAITVGLGFGLQEIFANFVSGLIILFERQIRVGDVVTVGDISGKVSRVQMRATTITDWDRKELIIPNKEFVTGQVINWSLSDTILRVIIPVGIAYGSDTELAYKTLMDVAHWHRNVLDTPEPTVRFLAFGESSLDFELRVFIPHPDLLLDTKHELHMEIDKRFREAKIEIAFPQRDIHIRNIPDGIINRQNSEGSV